MRKLLVLLLLTTFSTTTLSFQENDTQIKNYTINQSASNYLNSIGNYPSSYNKDRLGYLCGKKATAQALTDKSACFPEDVTNEILENYKNNNFLDMQGSGVINGGVPFSNDGTEDEGVK